MVFKHRARKLEVLFSIIFFFVANTVSAQIQDKKSLLIEDVQTFISFIDSIKNNRGPLVYYIYFHSGDTCKNGVSYSIRYLWNSYEREQTKSIEEYFIYKGKIILIEKNENVPQWVNFDRIDIKIEDRIASNLITPEKGRIKDEQRMEYIHWGCGDILMPRSVIRFCCGARFYAPDIIISR